jgi:hypothetical protein
MEYESHHLPKFTPFLWPSFVGKYTSTMEHMGRIYLAEHQNLKQFGKFWGPPNQPAIAKVARTDPLPL